MRSVPVLVLATLPFSLLACVSDSTTSPPSRDGLDASTNDASSSSQPDASSSSPDASSPSPDASATGDGSAINGTAAFDLTALPQGAFAYTQGSYLEGFEFTVPSPVHVTQLGYYDSSLTGTAQTFASADVGVYDITTSTLLGSVTVLAGDPAVGIFRFHPLTSDIPLGTTDTYAVVAVTGTDYYVSGFDYGGQLSTDLTWVGFAGHGPNNLTETTTLLQPDYFWNTTGNLGPDFLYRKD